MTYDPRSQMFARNILSSTGPNTLVLHTLHLRYPRIIHAELMTHRVFSRNARSSRAVPVQTMLVEVRETPFIPWHWGKNQKGMQAGEECNEPVLIPDWDDINFHGKPHLRSYTREEAWLHARDKGVDVAEAFMKAGYHKQLANRLLEPFMWIDVLVSSTDWDNFLWLRDHKDAEPHLQDLARLVKQAIVEAEIQMLEEDQWHLPYITNADRHQLLVDSGRLAGERYQKIVGTNDHFDWLKMISAARCARISYAPFDGDASYERELERYNQLVTSDRVHASPTEHQAQVDHFNREYQEWDEKPLSGNFAPGWIQHRKLIPNEAHHG